jgi:drug/metabolite transporter (DMT)-like permease
MTMSNAPYTPATAAAPSPTVGSRRAVWAAVALGITVVLWASGFVGIRAALRSFTPVQLASLRLLVAGICMGIYGIFAKVGVPRIKDIPLITLSGLLGLSLYSIALNQGELTVGAGAASFIVNTAPVITALLAAIFLSERLTLAGWIAFCVSFGGVTLIALGNSGTLRFSVGALFVLAAAVLIAGYFVLQKLLLRRYHALQLATWVMCAGAVVLLPFAGGALVVAAHAPTPAVLSAIYLGVGPGAVGYFAWTYALSHFSASRAAHCLYLIPPVSTMIAVVWLDELPSVVALIGGVFTMAGVALMTLRGKRTV